MKYTFYLCVNVLMLIYMLLFFAMTKENSTQFLKNCLHINDFLLKN